MTEKLWTDRVTNTIRWPLIKSYNYWVVELQLKNFIIFSTILMEKLDSTTTSGPFKVGVLTMEGECKTEDDNINVKLSHTEEKFVSGELLCLMGKL